MQKFLLAASSDFVTTVFPVLRYVFVAIMFLCSVFMIISTLLQSSNEENGAGVISGQESYYQQNKGESRDGKLKKITTFCAIVISVCAVLYFISLLING